MSTTKPIPGIQRGPDFDREVHDKDHVDKMNRQAKLDRPAEVNDPIINAAVEAVQEVSDSFERKVDVQYETGSGMIVLTVYAADGEEVIRRVPPEEAIRLSQHLKNERAKLFDSTF